MPEPVTIAMFRHARRAVVAEVQQHAEMTLPGYEPFAAWIFHILDKRMRGTLASSDADPLEAMETEAITTGLQMLAHIGSFCVDIRVRLLLGQLDLELRDILARRARDPFGTA